MEPEQVLEVGIDTPHGLPGVSSAHVAAEALVGGADVLQGEAVFFDPGAEFAELALHRPHCSPAHFPQDPAGLRQNELGLEEHDPAGDRPDLGLALVEPDTKLGADLFDPREAFPEVVHILVDQIAVVHIAAVALDPQLLLDNVVKQVGKHERRLLRDLTAEPVPDRAEVFEEGVRQAARPNVVHAPGKLLLDGPVLGVAEVVGKVKDENPALESVLAEMPLQMAVEAVHCKVDPFALDTRRVIVDKRGLKQGRDDLIA